jgi:hypothetical protein
MLSSHTPLRRAQRTRPSRASYYRVGAVNGSSAHSVSSRRLNRARTPQVVAHRESQPWMLPREIGVWSSLRSLPANPRPAHRLEVVAGTTPRSRHGQDFLPA